LQFAPDSPRINIFAFVLKSRGARDHFQSLQLGETIGSGALLRNIEAGQNTAVGASALSGNTSGFENTAMGAAALASNTTGFQNTANGTFALGHNTEGGGNTATGLSALFSNTIGSGNTATGAAALIGNTEGSQNTAIGFQALENNTEGGHNTAIGNFALAANTLGNFNTAVGDSAGNHSIDGDDNIAIGHNALPNNVSGSANIAVGLNAGGNVNTASNVICIGAIGADENNSCFIGNIFDQTSSGGTAVFVNPEGKLGTTTSSRRFKERIKPMENASDALFALKPVTFRYKTDRAHTPQFGLIAEEVAEANPELVVRDKEGNPYTVRYDAVNAMLLNEFLKEHKKVEEQGREIWEQRTEINRLGKTVKRAIARIEEQDLKTRRVNEQIEINQFATGRIRRDAPMRHIVRND
jgi:hypothetical protein